MERNEHTSAYVSIGQLASQAHLLERNESSTVAAAKKQTEHQRVRARARRKIAIKRQARERERTRVSERETGRETAREETERESEEGEEGVRGVGSKRELNGVFFTV